MRYDEGVGTQLEKGKGQKVWNGTTEMSLKCNFFGVEQRYLIGAKIRLRVRRHSALSPPMGSLRLTLKMALIVHVTSRAHAQRVCN